MAASHCLWKEGIGSLRGRRRRGGGAIYLSLSIFLFFFLFVIYLCVYLWGSESFHILRACFWLSSHSRALANYYYYDNNNYHYLLLQRMGAIAPGANGSDEEEGRGHYLSPSLLGYSWRRATAFESDVQGQNRKDSRKNKEGKEEEGGRDTIIKILLARLFSS